MMLRLSPPFQHGLQWTATKPHPRHLGSDQTSVAQNLSSTSVLYDECAVGYRSSVAKSIPNAKEHSCVVDPFCGDASVLGFISRVDPGHDLHRTIVISVLHPRCPSIRSTVPATAAHGRSVKKVNMPDSENSYGLVAKQRAVRDRGRCGPRRMFEKI